MILEAIKEAKDNGEVTKMVTGVCHYCGQASAVEVLATMCNQDANEAAVEVCNCGDAQYETQKKNRMERINVKINELFGSESTSPLDDSVVEELIQIGKLVAYDTIRKVTIDLHDNEKAKLSINKDNALVIVREKKSAKGTLA